MKPIQLLRHFLCGGVTVLVGAAGCSRNEHAPLQLVEVQPAAPATRPATIPFDDILSGSRGDWPDISQIRDGAATAPSALPATIPTTAPSAKFTAELNENVAGLITLSRKLF